MELWTSGGLWHCRQADELWDPKDRITPSTCYQVMAISEDAKHIQVVEVLPKATYLDRDVSKRVPFPRGMTHLLVDSSDLFIWFGGTKRQIDKLVLRLAKTIMTQGTKAAGL